MWLVFKANTFFCDTVKMPIPMRFRTPASKDLRGVWKNQPGLYDLVNTSIEDVPTLARQVKAQIKRLGPVEIRMLTDEQRVAGLREVIMMLIEFWQEHPQEEYRPNFHAPPSLLRPNDPIRWLNVFDNVDEIIQVLQNPMSTANRAEFHRCAPPHTKTFGAPCLNASFHTLVQNEARQNEKLTALMALVLNDDIPELQGKVNLGNTYCFGRVVPGSHLLIEEIAKKYDHTGINPDGGWFPINPEKDPLDLCGRMVTALIQPGSLWLWPSLMVHEVQKLPAWMTEYGFYLGFCLKRSTEEQERRDEIFMKLCGKTEKQHTKYMIDNGTRAEVWPSTKPAPCVNKAWETFARIWMLALMASKHPYWSWKKDEKGNWVPTQKPPAPNKNYGPFPYTETGLQNLDLIPGGKIIVDLNRCITRQNAQNEAAHLDIVPQTHVKLKKASSSNSPAAAGSSRGQPLLKHPFTAGDSITISSDSSDGGEPSVGGNGKGKEAADASSPPPAQHFTLTTQTVQKQVCQEVVIEETITDPETGESSRKRKTTTTLEESVSQTRMVGSSSKDSQAAAVFIFRGPTSPLLPSLRAPKLMAREEAQAAQANEVAMAADVPPPRRRRQKGKPHKLPWGRRMGGRPDPQEPKKP